MADNNTNGQNAFIEPEEPGIWLKILGAIFNVKKPEEVWTKVAKPALLNFVYNCVTKTAKVVILGDAVPNGQNTFINAINDYTVFAKQGTNIINLNNQTSFNQNASSGINCRIRYATEEEANSVRNTLIGIYEAYKMVKISDLYEYSKMPAGNPCLSNYGWLKNIYSSKVVPIAGGGFTIDLPNYQPLV